MFPEDFPFYHRLTFPDVFQVHVYLLVIFMWKTLDSISPGKYWLDATDLLNPGVWLEMTDKKPLNYTNWATSGHVDEDNDKNCVFMSVDLAYKWEIASCSDKINFVCWHAG